MEQRPAELDHELHLGIADDVLRDLYVRGKYRSTTPRSSPSYFAFTATPKNKTLEIFSQPEPRPDGPVKHRPFHSYTMKHAIQEGFIVDVLRHYTPVNSYYRLVKKIEGDPRDQEAPPLRGKPRARHPAQGRDHGGPFHEQVLALNKLGGEARAMVVTSGIERAIQYYHAIRVYLVERKSRYRAIVAFSGEHEYAGAPDTLIDTVA